MVEAALRLLAGLLPDHTADPEVTYRYLMRLGLTTSGLFLGLLAITITAFGFFPAWSEGFAHAADVHSLVAEIRTNRVQQIDGQLLELRTKHCQAQTDEGRRLYWEKISALLQEYQHLTGRTYYLPACTDL